LIYCGSWIDWQRIDPEKIEPVAVVGNSLGWYTALAVSGSLDFDSGFTLVDSMGRIQDDLALGQQLIYPLVGENWQSDPEREERFQEALQLVAGQVWESIRFGGFSVLGGESPGLDALEAHLAPVELGGRSYPFRLAGSRGFHTPLAAEVSQEAVKTLTQKIGWSAPRIPLIDGQGRVWSPWSTDPAELARYTLERQVVGLFDFQAAVRGALTEFGPEAIVLLGPGDSLGAAVGQTLIRSGWWGIQDRADFQSRQNSNVPVVVSMGRSDQAQTVLR
jgi:malonyl CoA-acyl carrier protein transacylase